MKFKNGMILSVLLIVLILFTVSAASAADWDFTIEDNSVIYLENNTYEITSQITIDKENVTIYGGFEPASGDGWDGNTSTIDGCGHLIMNITGNNVKLVGIKFINGSNTEGGALYIKNNATIENCEFINNTATSKGGAIYAANPVASSVNPDTYNNPIRYSISLKNCLFENNTALQGGAVYTFIMKTDIVNCTFIGNNATQVRGNAGTIAAGAGGALYIQSNDRDTRLSSYNDYAYINWGDKLSITDSKFVDNHAPKAEGGAIYSFRPKEGYLDNNTFENNTALRTGTIMLQGTLWFKSTTDIVNCKFNHNSADVFIGGVYYGNVGNSIVKNCEFNDNSGGLQTGALQGYESHNLTIDNCTFNHNTVLTDDTSHSEGNGGAIFLQETRNCTVINSKFIKNSAFGNGNGGAIWISNDKSASLSVCNDLDTYCSIVNSIFIDNEACFGGAIYLDQGTVAKTEGLITLTVSIKNSTFINNTANTAGAIYDNNLKQFNIENSIFDNSTDSEGTCIYLTNDNYTLEKNFFATNDTITSEEFKNAKIISKNGEGVTPEEIIVLKINASDSAYKLIFISNKTDSAVDMPYYEANVTINNKNSINVPVNKNQTITEGGKVNITATSIHSKNFLANLTKTFKDNVDITVSAPGIVFGEDAKITVILTPSDATGSVNITINGKSYNKTLFAGKCTFTVGDLTVGTHPIQVSYSGDTKYNPAIKTSNIIVKPETKTKVTMDVSVPDIVFGENATITISFTPKDATGTVTVSVDGKSYNGTVKNGTCTVTVGNLTVGIHNIQVSYSGDAKYKPANKTVNIAVKLDPEMVVEYSPEVIYEGDNVTVIVNLPSNATGNVTFRIEGLLGWSTEKIINGTAKYTYARLKEGIYNITVYYKGNDIYIAKSSNISFEVKTKDMLLETFDVTKYYKGEERFIATLTQKGVGIANQTVTFTINGKTYTKTTDENGTASLAINLNPGTYKMLTSYRGIVRTNTVIVKSTIQSDNIIKYYLNGTQYEAYVIDSKGNPLDNANVTLNIHGVFYKKVAHNGTVKLNINLAPGQYIITAYNEVTGDASSSYIVVLPTIYGKDLNMTYQDGSKYECKLVDGHGNPVKGAEVILNIHGVFYHKITDDEGIIRLNINLLPGQYIITAIYGSAMTSNMITVRDL